MTRTLLIPIALIAGLAGCAEYEKIYQPAEYHPGTEMKPGPGLFTGDSGVVTLCCGRGAAVDGADIGLGSGETVVDGKPGEPIVVKRQRSE